MKRWNTRLLLLPILALPAYGAGVYAFTCDNQPVIKGAFLGANAGIVACTSGNMNASITPGATAGLDEFLNTIDVNVDNTHAVAGEIHNVTGVSTSNPTWNVPMAGTYLELDGTVRISDQGDNASLTVNLNGLLGGPALDIGPLTFTKASGCPCSIALFTTGIQATAANAVETITIATVGRASYNAAGTPTFASPEPGTAWLLGLGALALSLLGRGKLRTA